RMGFGGKRSCSGHHCNDRDERNRPQRKGRPPMTWRRPFHLARGQARPRGARGVAPCPARAARWASAPMRALTVGRLAAVARMKKYAFIAFGVIFLVVGIVALAIPVLPTSPFLILAAYCFSKGADYLHDWLLNHKWFGPPIKDWRRNGAIKV